MMTSGDKAEIAFFDLETTVPTRVGQGRVIWEFGAILVCPRKLIVLENYSTLVRPHDLSLISSLYERPNGITKDALVSAPTFAEIADKVYDILHGRIWAGHNILRFDCPRIREAFAEINRQPQEPKGTLDSLEILTQKFGRRAGDMKMASLATYFGIGPQTHRSLDDVRMNLAVLKCCAAVLFFDSSLADVFAENRCVSPIAITERTSEGNTGGTEFLEPDEVSFSSIFVIVIPFFRGTPKIEILHDHFPLQLCCRRLKVRFGVSPPKFFDNAGRPRLSFVVNASPSVCEVLEPIDNLAHKFSVDCGSNSKWRPTVTRKSGYWRSPTLRLNLHTISDGNGIRWVTEIYQEESSSTQRLVFSRFDVTELEPILTSGTIVDVYFSLDPYDYQQNAGIRLVAKKLFIHSN